LWHPPQETLRKGEYEIHAKSIRHTIAHCLFSECGRRAEYQKHLGFLKSYEENDKSITETPSVVQSSYTFDSWYSGEWKWDCEYDYDAALKQPLENFKPKLMRDHNRYYNNTEALRNEEGYNAYVKILKSKKQAWDIKRTKRFEFKKQFFTAL
jgi:hypothetical protein